MDNDNFKTTDITRDKARKLCLLLLEHQIFEPLSSSSSSSMDKKFEDVNNRYYKFTSTLDVALQRNTIDAAQKPSTTVTTELTPPASTTQAKTNEKDSITHEVVSSPGSGGGEGRSDPDYNGNIIQELLGLTDAGRPDHSEALKDINNIERVCKTASGQIKKPCNDRVFVNKRSSMNCEAAFQTGTLPRTISAGVGIAGVFTRKRSALNLPSTSSQSQEELEVPAKRSTRQRRASAETDFSEYAHSTKPRAKPMTASERYYNLRYPQQRAKSTEPSQSNDLLSRGCSGGRSRPRQRVRRHSSVTDVTLPQSDETGGDIIGCATVEKLAKLTGEVIFSPSAIAELRQEIALSQLSQLLELPILEGLVCATSYKKEDTGYDNTVFFNVDQKNAMGLDLSSSDAWLHSAMEVFDYMPNGHKTTFDYQIGLNPADYKLALYKSIVRCYRARTDSLFPACHEQIHLAVLGLVMSGSEEKAVLSMRLAAILLPCYLMAEITTLLEFLHTISLSPEPKLKPGQNNNDAVLNDFSGIFFMGCKLLSMDQRRILLLLMMRYCDKLTRVPSSVQQTLEKTMQSLKQGDDTPTPSTLFCNQLTSREYEKQQRDVTEKAIVSLVKNVIDDTEIPLKEKQKHIKQFNKHHTAIMKKYFSDIV